MRSITSGAVGAVASAQVPANYSGEVVDDAGNRLFGLDAEVYLKLQAKRDPERERSLLRWAYDTAGDAALGPPSGAPPADAVAEALERLRSGATLCRLALAVFGRYAVAKVHLRQIALLEMENIQSYLSACWTAGIPSAELFVASDLYRKKGLAQVFVNLEAVQRYAARAGLASPLAAAAPANAAAPAKAAASASSPPQPPRRRPPPPRVSAVEADIAADQARARENAALRKVIAEGAGQNLAVAPELLSLRAEVAVLREQLTQARLDSSRSAVGNNAAVKKASDDLIDARDREEQLAVKLRAVEDERAQLQDRVLALEKGAAKGSAASAASVAPEPQGVQQSSALEEDLSKARIEAKFWKDKLAEKQRLAIRLEEAGKVAAAEQKRLEAELICARDATVAAEAAAETQRDEARRAIALKEQYESAVCGLEAELAASEQRLALALQDVTDAYAAVADAESEAAASAAAAAAATAAAAAAGVAAAAAAPAVGGAGAEQSPAALYMSGTLSAVLDSADVAAQVRGLNRSLTRIFYSPHSVAKSDFDVFLDFVCTEPGARQFARCVSFLGDHAPAEGLADDAFELLLWLLLRVFSSLQGCGSRDFRTAFILANFAMRTYRFLPDGRAEFLGQFLGDLNVFDPAVWEEGFYMILAEKRRYREQLLGADADAESGDDDIEESRIFAAGTLRSLLAMMMRAGVGDRVLQQFAADMVRASGLEEDSTMLLGSISSMANRGLHATVDDTVPRKSKIIPVVSHSASLPSMPMVGRGKSSPSKKGSSNRR